ncbi:uncharacterized protein LOC125499737 [Athalia rosae]|uniref:uncharacterized protein LOC125499737 n=1 Tax=Athalia rosae TaxID=37344 RepID=UPI00203403C5|nr:uncharacterized protein LOC125499737 [Athalia rosae]
MVATLLENMAMSRNLKTGKVREKFVDDIMNIDVADEESICELLNNNLDSPAEVKTTVKELFDKERRIGADRIIQSDDYDYVDTRGPWKTTTNQMPVVLDSKFEINSMAKKYKTAAQIILQHQVHRGHVICHKSLTKSLTEESLDIFDFELTNEDIELIEFLA